MTRTCSLYSRFLKLSNFHPLLTRTYGPPIVALALSTATFAWYSAGQGEVATNQLELVAQAPTSADIRIAKTSPGQAYANWSDKTAAIDLTAFTDATYNNKLTPAVIYGTQPGTADAWGSVTNVKNALVDGSTFKSVTDGNYYTDTFVVATLSTETTNVTGSVTMTDGAKDLYYVLLIDDQIVDTNAKIADIAPANDAATNSITMSEVSGKNASFALTAMSDTVTAHTVRVVLWIDGVNWIEGDYVTSDTWNVTVTISKI